MSTFDDQTPTEPTGGPDPKQVWRDAYKDRDLLDLIGIMAAKRADKEEAEESLAMVNAAYDVLRLELIPAKMEEEGVENIKVEGVGRVSLTGDMYVSVPVAMREKFFDWLRANNLGDLIKEQVASSTLKAFVKNRIKGGKELPTDLVKYTPFTRASITKA